jgi:hypothetical protein
LATENILLIHVFSNPIVPFACGRLSWLERFPGMTFRLHDTVGPHVARPGRHGAA